jgi:hypothetical protein
MKNRKAFEKWFNEPFTFSINQLSSLYSLYSMVWEACEEYYESRKCEDCKYSKSCDKFDSVSESIRCYYSDLNSLDFKYEDKNYCCKYWEKK